MKEAQIGVDDSIVERLNDELKVFHAISKELKKKIGREISEFDGGVFRKELAEKGTNGLLQLTIGYSGSDIERGTRVALFKTFTTELLTYDIFYKSLKLVGGTAIHVGRQDFLSSSQPDINPTKDSGTNFSMPPEI